MLSHLRQSANLLRCIQPVASAASNSFAEASLIVQLTDRLRLANADCNIASQRAAQGTKVQLHFAGYNMQVRIPYSDNCLY